MPQANPFALLVAPETILAAIDRSEPLMRLRSRICRPLDNPRPVAASKTEVETFDTAIESDVLDDPDWQSIVSSWPPPR